MEEGKKMWQVVYSPEDKTFEASTSFACQEAWDEAELIDNGWAVVVEADNKAEAMRLGFNMIKAAMSRQEAVLKDLAEPKIAKAEAERGPKWWDVCYSVHTKQYSVREAPFTLTGSQKDGEIDDDKGCYRIYVQAPNKKMACIDADFRIGQYLLRLQTDMAYAVRRSQQKYFFDDDEEVATSVSADDDTTNYEISIGGDYDDEDKTDLTYHGEEESQWKL